MNSMHRLSAAICLTAIFAVDSVRAADWEVAPNDVAGTRKPAVLVDIDKLERTAIDALKSQATGAGWWLELGDTLLLAGDLGKVRSSAPGARIRELGELAPEDLILHARGCGDSVLSPSLSLHTGLSYELMRRTASTQSAPAAHASHLGAAEWLAVVPNTVLAKRFEVESGTRLQPDPAILPIVAAVSAPRWYADVEALANFDRSSYSTELPAARAYIVQQFAALGLSIEEPEFQFTYYGNNIPQPATVSNVVGRWTGTRNPNDWIVVGGHYDSRNSVNTAPVATPGADDNASGCSGVIEAARALTRFRPQSTLIFMCYAGEEQGLHGSVAHVNALSQAGQLGQVSRMVNMDMIGWSATADIGVIIETNSANAALMTELGNAGAIYAPEIDVITDFVPCCTDLMPYLNAGRPAITSIHRGSAGAYPHYHRSTDVPVNLGPHSQAVGGAIIRMNVAALAQASGASDVVFNDSYD